jgi:hypothetical protein
MLNTYLKCSVCRLAVRYVYIYVCVCVCEYIYTSLRGKGLRLMGGDEVQLHYSFTTALREVSGELNAPTALPPGTYPVLTEYEAGSLRFGEDKTSCPCCDSIPGLSSLWLFATPTQLFQLQLL